MSVLSVSVPSVAATAVVLFSRGPPLSLCLWRPGSRLCQASPPRRPCPERFRRRTSTTESAASPTGITRGQCRWSISFDQRRYRAVLRGRL